MTARGREAWFVLLPFAAGFFISNYFRSVNAVLSTELVSDLKLTAGDLGLLSSVYFFTTAGFQLPLGLFMDRFGPGPVQSALMIIASGGVLVFASAPDFWMASFGRAVMGIGAAGALMTSFQAIIFWFPRERWPFLNGIVLAAGGIGVFAATAPTQQLLQAVNWRELMLLLAGLSCAASLAVLLLVPKGNPHPARSSVAEQLADILSIYKNPVFIRVAPIQAATVGGNLAFQGLWAGPWLRDVAALTATQAANALLIVSLLQILGYVGTGWIAGRLDKIGVELTSIIKVGTFLFVASQAGLLLPTGSARWIVLIGTGLLANVNVLAYPLLASQFAPEMVGRLNTALNFFVFLGAFLLQYLVGDIIGFFQPLPESGYSSFSYQVAFGVMCLCQLTCWLWLVRPGR